MQISQNQYIQLDQIRQKHELSLILLHGSQATGKTHSKSDIDIAILQRKNAKSDLNFGACLTDLTDVFMSDKVDVANLTKAHPLLLKTVTDKAKLLAGSVSDFDKLKLKAFHRYNDYQPYFQIEHKTVNSLFGVAS